MKKVPKMFVLYPKLSTVLISKALGLSIPPALVTVKHPNGSEERFMMGARQS